MQVKVIVKPNSKKGPLIEEIIDGLIVYTQSPAVDGKANAAVIALLAKHFQVSKSKVILLKGEKNTHKQFLITVSEDS